MCNLPVTRNLPLAVVDSLRVGTVNTGGGTPSSRRPFSFTLCHRGSEPGSENSLMTALGAHLELRSSSGSDRARAHNTFNLRALATVACPRLAPPAPHPHPSPPLPLQQHPFAPPAGQSLLHTLRSPCLFCLVTRAKKVRGRTSSLQPHPSCLPRPLRASLGLVLISVHDTNTNTVRTLPRHASPQLLPPPPSHPLTPHSSRLSHHTTTIMQSSPCRVRAGKISTCPPPHPPQPPPSHVYQ